MEITLRDIGFELKPEDVKKAVRALPEGTGKKYAVLIEGRRYPPKDVLLNVLKGRLTKADFTTQDAVRILRKFGFEIVEVEEHTKKKRLSVLAGLVSLGGDSVKDSEAYYG